ncbi:hypothetical protein IV203_027089 [Nitzschia inconspicua]|uniref:Uncharacterized protein n=1 Tax=Nitzschia inconspicua TaxID=303405 RepID=A0A9K3LKD7_9STRA|nr:hypothetical protein IV203_027089 [Nitzschia inconspicua]
MVGGSLQQDQIGICPYLIWVLSWSPRISVKSRGSMSNGRGFTPTRSDWNMSILDLGLELVVENLSQVKRFHVEWSEGIGIKLDMEGSVLFKATTAVMTTLKSGFGQRQCTKEITSIPLYAVDCMVASDKIKEIVEESSFFGWRFKMPDLKVVVFLELIFVTDVFLKLQENLETKTVLGLTSLETKFIINVDTNNNPTTTRQINTSEANSNLEVKPVSFGSPLDPLRLLPDQLKLDGFIGVRQQAVAYATSILMAAVSMEVDAGVRAEIAPSSEGFPKVDTVLGSSSECSACHAAEIEFQLVLRKVGFYVVLVFDIHRNSRDWSMNLDLFSMELIKSIAIPLYVYCFIAGLDLADSEDQCEKKVTVSFDNECSK